jgi:hypothetical protein
MIGLKSQPIPEYLSFACELGMAIRVHGSGPYLVESWYTTIRVDTNMTHLINRGKPLILMGDNSSLSRVKSWVYDCMGRYEHDQFN